MYCDVLRSFVWFVFVILFVCCFDALNTINNYVQWDVKTLVYKSAWLASMLTLAFKLQQR